MSSSLGHTAVLLNPNLPKGLTNELDWNDEDSRALIGFIAKPLKRVALAGGLLNSKVQLDQYKDLADISVLDHNKYYLAGIHYADSELFSETGDHKPNPVNSIAEIGRLTVMNRRNTILSLQLKAIRHDELVRANESVEKIVQQKGAMVEQAVLAILKYDAKLSQISIPTPVYLDMRNVDAQHNFDICYSTSADGHRIQVKSACFGICKGLVNKRLRQVRELYSENIQLVSGCCHLGVNTDEPHRLAIIGSLMNQERPELPQRTEQLADTSGRLRRGLSEDMLPRGRYSKPNGRGHYRQSELAKQQ